MCSADAAAWFGAVGVWLGAAATFAAVLVALSEPKKVRKAALDKEEALRRNSRQHQAVLLAPMMRNALQELASLNEALSMVLKDRQWEKHGWSLDEQHKDWAKLHGIDDMKAVLTEPFAFDETTRYQLLTFFGEAPSVRRDLRRVCTVIGMDAHEMPRPIEDAIKALNRARLQARDLRARLQSIADEGSGQAPGQ